MEFGEIQQNKASASSSPDEKGFAKIKMLLEATGGLSLSQVCAVTGLEGSTIQNWVKRGWVAHPKGKKYEEIHIARILIINALKECIKLEHIAMLMVFVNGSTDDPGDDIIRESELYNYLCKALQLLGKADDLSRGGVESVVAAVIRDYQGPTPDARDKLRKALTVMIFACVTTDVKRRTEAMMEQVLRELENPEIVTEVKPRIIVEVPVPPTSVSNEEMRKTVSQALREWDLSRVEDVLNEDTEEIIIPEVEPFVEPFVEPLEPSAPKQEDNAEKSQKPWYFRRN